MPGASLMMRFFESPPRESRSASGPGTEADYQQGGGEDPGALRAARTSGKGRESRTTPELYEAPPTDISPICRGC